MNGQIAEEVKQERRDRAMAEQLDIARQVAASQVGRVMPVLVEKSADAKELHDAQVSSWEHGLVRSGPEASAPFQGKYYVARGEADAPDIDGRVYIRGHLPIGKFVDVKIIGHTDYDLLAEPA